MVLSITGRSPRTSTQPRSPAHLHWLPCTPIINEGTICTWQPQSKPGYGTKSTMTAKPGPPHTTLSSPRWPQLVLFGRTEGDGGVGQGRSGKWRGVSASTHTVRQASLSKKRGLTQALVYQLLGDAIVAYMPDEKK